MVRADQQDMIYKTATQSGSGRRRRRRALREGPTGPHRYRLGREVEALVPHALQKRGIPHKVLNAKHHEKEARSSRRPAASAAITVATNMAGRGVDIILGGTPRGWRSGEMSGRLGQRRSTLLDEYNRRSGPNTRPSSSRSSRSSRSRRRPNTRKVLEAGGTVRSRHRTTRVAPYRQPAAWPIRPSGRPGREPVLPLLEDDLMRLFASDRIASDDGASEDPGRRSDRGQDGVESDRARPVPGRDA